jgi:hypothetical protein
MKKLFLLLISIVLITACSSDDDSNSNKLATPVLLTPSNNTTITVSQNGWNEFKWAEVANAKQYLVQISETSNFSTILDEATALVNEDEPHYNTNMPFLLYSSTQHQSTYYWRVRAFAPDYDPSDYSTTFSFVVNKE